MRINGIDVRKYGAKQLTVDIQPPKMAASYEMMAKSLLPTEYETDIPMGSMNMTIYFIESNRATLQRTMSSFMELFKYPCVIDEIKGFKGKYKAYLKDDTYNKTLKNQKAILKLDFDGYFFDEEKTAEFNGKTEGKLYAEGSRNTYCTIEITAKSELSEYTVVLNGEKYIVDQLETGKTIVINGNTGKITMDGANAFDHVDMWEFPRLHSGENMMEFSSAQANVKIRYVPMWL